MFKCSLHNICIKNCVQFTWKVAIYNHRLETGRYRKLQLLADPRT